jgi:hypothetical protein
LKNLAEKCLSEKVSLRIKDALSKLEGIGQALIQSETDLMKEELGKAIADGTITKGELTDIAEKLANKAMITLKPEMSTLIKYFCGENLLDALIVMFKKWIVDFATAKFKKEVVKLVPVVPFPSALPTK